MKKPQRGRGLEGEIKKDRTLSGAVLHRWGLLYKKLHAAVKCSNIALLLSVCPIPELHRPSIIAVDLGGLLYTEFNSTRTDSAEFASLVVLS